MKRISALIITFIILSAFIINAFSLDIDGISNGYEWHDAVSYELVKNDSNCNITRGYVKVKFDNENSALYMCFTFVDPYIEQGNLNCGLSISVNGSSTFIVDASSSPINDDIDKYSFDGAVAIDENNGVTSEIRIGFKEGLTRIVECDVQMIDSEGEPSNHYLMNLVNEGFSEKTVINIFPTADNEDPNYNSDIISTKKTTKAKTEKVATTKKKSVTEKKTTSTKNYVVQDSPMTYSRRTVARRTTSTTRIIEKETVNCVTIYYFEREVIISHVPVTVIVTESTEISDTEIVVESSSAEESSTADTVVKNLSVGSRYKKILIFSGAAAFGLIAIFGVIYTKKNKPNV